MIRIPGLNIGSFAVPGQPSININALVDGHQDLTTARIDRGTPRDSQQRRWRIWINSLREHHPFGSQPTKDSRTVEMSVGKTMLANVVGELIVEIHYAQMLTKEVSQSRKITGLTTARRVAETMFCFRLRMHYERP